MGSRMGIGSHVALSDVAALFFPAASGKTFEVVDVRTVHDDRVYTIALRGAGEPSIDGYFFADDLCEVTP